MDGDLGHLFNNLHLYHVDNMDQLQKFIVLAKDQGLTTDSSGRVMETCVIASILALVVWTPTIVATPILVVTTIPSITPKVE